MNRKKIIVENSAPSTECISEINNTQTGNAKYIDGIMPMYNLIEEDQEVCGNNK